MHCIYQPDLPKLKAIERRLLIVVVILQRAKRVLRVYVSALVKMNARVHLYRKLRLDIDFHEDELVRENGRANLRADVHTGDENYFGLDVEDADEDMHVNADLESVKEVIVVGLKVIVVVKPDEVTGWMHVDECCLILIKFEGTKLFLASPKTCIVRQGHSGPVVFYKLWTK